MAWIDYKKVYDMIPQSMIINYLKMYIISDEDIKYIEKTTKTRRVVLTAGRESFAETNIQRAIFQGDALAPLVFITVTMPLNHILRKCTVGYKLTKSQEKMRHMMYMDDIKLFAKNLEDEVKKKTMKHESNADTNCGWCTLNNPHRNGKGTEGLGNKRTSGDHPDNRIIKIIQNTEK